MTFFRRPIVMLALLAGLLVGAVALVRRATPPSGVNQANIPETLPNSPAPAIVVAEARRDELTVRDGRRYRQGDVAPFTGVMTEFYKSGICQSRSGISNGLPEGLSEGWYTNGQKQVEERYHEGVSHGVRTKWYENGRILSEGTVVTGKLEGVFRRWHESGALAEEVPMRGGNPDGLARAFYPSGCLKAEAHLDNGKVLERKNWGDGEKPLNGNTAGKGQL